MQEPITLPILHAITSANILENPWTKNDLIPNLDKLNHSQLVDLIDKELNIPLENIQASLGVNQFEKLMQLIDIPHQEQQKLDVNNKERGTIISQITHTIGSSAIGLASGVLGFFVLTNIIFAGIILAGTIIYIPLLGYLSKVNRDKLIAAQKKAQMK